MASRLIELVLTGRNRFVFLIGPLAIKIPSLRCWRDFLYGLLNNMNEWNWRNEEGHCPVLFSWPGGLFIVMPRCEPVSQAEFELLDKRKLPPRPERKPESFGWLNSRLVAIDYGW